MAKKVKKDKEKPFKVFGDLDDVLKSAVKGNPMPNKKKEKGKK